MTTVKTAISLKKRIYKQMDVMARRLRVPRSQLCSMALEDFFRRYETKELMRKLNEAYADPTPLEEQAALKRMQRLSWATVKDRW
jgi:metal-responsive CopG/Arc/MetJ family transcriptional regulator